MNINIYYIQKKLDTNEFASKYERLISSFARLNQTNVFSSEIAKAKDAKAAKAAYSQAFNQFNKLRAKKIALSEDGKLLDSLEFAKLFQDEQSISFYIGGAYGLEDEFKANCDVCLSLSKLTTTHELARILLLEQIYRACSINAAHPYHK